MLILKLHGGFRACDAEGREISIKSRKAKALLAYLASPLGKLRSRETITALLWSERGDEQARGSLRQALRGLRQDLGEELSQVLRVTNDGLALNPDRVSVVNASSGEEFLEGFHVNDPAFDEWLRDERLRLEDRESPKPKQQAPNHSNNPSIAVLPFVNMSQDPEQEYFADGITEDITTTLAKTPQLSVIGWDSTRKYKDEKYDPEHIGQEQGVQYLLEGSVRHSGNRLRVSAKLIDAANGKHLWADRYERVVDDVFAVQDEITREVILALQVKLTDGERARMFASGTKSFEAWQLVSQASGLLNNHDKADTGEAQRLIRRALEIDESYVMAHITMGWIHWMEVYAGWTDSPERSLELAYKAASRAQAIDPDNADVYPLLAMIHVSNRSFGQADREIQKAISLQPKNSKVLGIAANVAISNGEPRKAVELMNYAMRLCPTFYAWYPGDLADAYFLLGELDHAESACRTALECDPEYMYSKVTLTMTLAKMGRIGEAREMAKEVVKLDPSFSIGPFIKGRSFRRESDEALMNECLHAAGLPE